MSGPERSQLRLKIEFMTPDTWMDTGRPNSRRNQDAVGSLCRKVTFQTGQKYRTKMNRTTGTVWVYRKEDG